MRQPGGGEDEALALVLAGCLRELVGGGVRAELVGVEVHADAEGGSGCLSGRPLTIAADVIDGGGRRGRKRRRDREREREREGQGEPAGGRFLSPALVGVVEVGFAVVRKDFTSRRQCDGRVVGCERGRGEEGGHGGLGESRCGGRAGGEKLWVADADEAAEPKGGGGCPFGCWTCSCRLEVRFDGGERGEVVA